MVLAALFPDDGGTVIFCLWYPVDFHVSLTRDNMASTYRIEK